MGFWAPELRATEAGVEDDGSWLDERRLFLGSSRSKGAALVAPTLEEHVAGKLAQESSVLKEKRKGREEKRLAKEAAGKEAASGSANPKEGRGRGRGRKR